MSSIAPVSWLISTKAFANYVLVTRQPDFFSRVETGSTTWTRFGFVLKYFRIVGTLHSPGFFLPSSLFPQLMTAAVWSDVIGQIISDF